MRGRLEHKIVTEKKLQGRLSEENAPQYMMKFYYALNQNSHTTKLRYIDNVIRFMMFYGNGEFIPQSKLNDIDAFDIERFIESIQYYNKEETINELEGTSKAVIYSSLL